MRKLKNLLRIIDIKKIIFNFKSLLFKNIDIISEKEIKENEIVSSETKSRLLNLKKLRKLNNIYYIWDYNKEFKKLIFSYKYHRKKILAKLISQLIKEEFEFVIQREKIDMIISVPINIKRKNERGYNQIDEILKHLNVSYIKIKRIKNTEKMHKLLDEKLREKNIKNSIYIDKNIDFKNKTVLIVDDIITTGATLREIKKSILKNLSSKYEINKKHYKNVYKEDIEKYKIKIIIFSLAAAREIKINKGEI